MLKYVIAVENIQMIKLENVTYKYGEEAKALEDVSLEIEKGRILAVVGHNGSGKSTLAKHFNALLLPSEGRVTVDGMDTKNPDNTLKIRKKVGMVFQNPDNQLVTTVVEEDVAFGPENLGIPAEEIRRRVDAAIDAVGMSEYATSAPHMLSGGQKQRIAIAGMLAMEPEVLVLDEATAMLDPQGRQDVLEIVERVNRERGMTVVMITQYMEETVIADKVAVMKGGHLLMTGTPREVFSRGEELRANGLDLPAIARLRDELIAGGMDIPKDAITAQELAEAICR